MTELEFAQGKTLSEEEINNWSREIADYCLSQVGYSYYDLKKYVYDNDLYEWIICLRKKKVREFISTLLREKHKSEKVKYKNKYADILIAAGQAEVDFYKRHNFDKLDVNSSEEEE